MNVRQMLGMRTAILLLACASPALGTDRYWNGNGGADQSWFNAANWVGNAQPTSSDHAYVGSNVQNPASAVISQPGAVCQNLYLGYGGTYAGALTIQAGGQLNNSAGYLGYDTGSSGAATVNGAGSNWTTSGVFVGLSGRGTLDIEAGGQVSNSSGFIGRLAGSSGMATVNGAGSKWTTPFQLWVGWNGTGMLTVSNGGLVTTGTLNASLSDLYGNGTITAAGAVIDADLVFDPAHPQGTPLTFGTGGALNLVQDATHSLGVGFKGSGTLRIINGVAVASGSGTLGYFPGSNGTATVSGAGSKWTNAELQVGGGGGGALNVLAGGQIISDSGGAHLGSNFGARATATVSGVGSKWTTTGQLEAFDDGSGGSATLTVADGGQLTAHDLAVAGNSAVRLHVSGDNMMVLGTAATAGSIQNSGRINFYAGPTIPAGTYHPISEYADRAMTWTGSGSYIAVGGTWSNSAHTFLVPSVTEMAAGTVGSISSGQRLRFTDASSGKKIGASFGTVTSGATFSASLLAQSELDMLMATAGFKGSVLWAWDFNTNVSAEVLLSGSAGPDDLAFQVWRFQGGAWTPYTPSLQSYTSDGMLSFTADHFSGFAVTSVPEPASLGLLTAGLLLLGWRTRRRGVASISSK